MPVSQPTPEILMKKIFGGLVAAAVTVRLIARAVEYYRLNPTGKRKYLNEL